tara:strand:- start:2338 stop:2550 length:213 start_codon:yes stop_codon:yes gene_type:complete
MSTWILLLVEKPKGEEMLNILSGAFNAATRTNSTITPLGQDERHQLFLEQSRRERRLQQLKADQRFYRQA